MISGLFHAAFYEPIHNALVALVSFMPGGDIGLAVVVLTLFIRLILLPFSLSAARTQRAMKDLQPKIQELKEKHKGNKELEAKGMLDLYREARVNPFSSILIVLIQLPLLLALYLVFFRETFASIDPSKLYAFTPIPETTTLLFLGLVAVSGKSIVLSVLAGITQYLQAQAAMKGSMQPSGTGMQADFQKVMGFQLRYVFPFIIAAISYTTSGAIALYFITTNIAGFLQEKYVTRTLNIADESRAEQNVLKIKKG